MSVSDIREQLGRLPRARVATKNAARCASSLYLLATVTRISLTLIQATLAGQNKNYGDGVDGARTGLHPFGETHLIE
jgi:hypothetical protein